MAYNDSGELPVSQMYGLGKYIFELKVQTVHEPGEEDVVSIYAICREFGGTTRETQAVDYPEGTTVESWSVECNETEATVYANLKTGAEAHLKPGSPSAVSGSVYVRLSIEGRYYTCTNTSEPVLAGYVEDNGWTTPVLIGPRSYDIRGRFNSSWTSGPQNVQETATIENVEFVLVRGGGVQETGVVTSGNFLGTFDDMQTALETLAANYYNIKNTIENQIICRFAIDIREADTDSWDEPGDDGPPGTTLNVTVTGATAGSCAGTPSDNETVKGYGDGGDGGYGGGGGAGASTVIIYEFATDIAESVQQEAISRGPGTGGPGGKGGKGGDGCILIFY